MAEVHAGPGRIELFEDFCGPEWIIAETAASGAMGQFRIIGDGTEDTDSGITIDESTVPLNGVGIFTTTNEDKHAVFLATSKCIDVAKMAPIVMECRVQFADLDSKGFYMGLTDTNADDLAMEDDMIIGSATTLTLTASDICGFYLDEALTDDEDWHGVYNGGTTTGATVSTTIDLDDDAVAGEWQILRLEIDPNGTARWLIDGVLKQTVSGAVSTSVDLAALCGVEARAISNEYAYVDYFYVSFNRDWTV